MDLTDRFSSVPKARALIIMGSGSDVKHGENIANVCTKLGVKPVLRVNSAHKVSALICKKKPSSFSQLAILWMWFLSLSRMVSLLRSSPLLVAPTAWVQ